METAARIGWLARGVLYVLVATLVARIPSVGGERSADKQGAFATLAASPFGGWLLGAVVVGMLGFAAWRAWSAIRGSEVKTTRRLAWAGSSLVYLGLAGLALGILLRGDDGSNEEKALTARALELPGGTVLVGGVAVAVLATGVNHLRKAAKQRFLRDIDEDAIPARVLRPVRVIGVLGQIGRAFVWGLVGWFLLRAAVQHDPSEPIGLDEALRNLADESWGPALLRIASACLLAYAVLCFAIATWPDPEPDDA
jgi:hypothetical protein